MFDSVPRALDKFDRRIKDLERYLGETYIDRRQPAIMAKTMATFFYQEIPKVTTDTSAKSLKMDAEITYLKNIISIKLSVRNRGRNIFMKPTLTISTILLGVRQTSNYSRRRHWTPPYRWSKQADAQLGT